MDQTTVLDTFRNPFGNQEIELQQIEHADGGMPMLRIRIRERAARFTIFDMDPLTARDWARTMLAWAEPMAAAHGAPANEEDSR